MVLGLTFLFDKTFRTYELDEVAALPWLTVCVLCLQPISDLFRPNRQWGPALMKHRRLTLRYVDPREFDLDPFDYNDVAFAKSPASTKRSRVLPVPEEANEDLEVILQLTTQNSISVYFLQFTVIC